MLRLQSGFIKSLKFCHHHRPGSGRGNRGAFSTGMPGLLVQVAEGGWVSQAVTPLSQRAEAFPGSALEALYPTGSQAAGDHPTSWG